MLKFINSSSRLASYFTDVPKVLSRSIHLTREMSGNRVAVVLAGSGVYDGSEVHEASAVWVHLSRGGADVSFFAPDIPQMHVINHTKGEPSENETRNVLVESARIARGKITALSGLSSGNFDAVVFPGGFGAAKNLSDFAVNGAGCTVNPDVERVIKEFHQAKKPIGLCCISPVLAAKVIPGCSVTVGHDSEEGGRWPYAGTAKAIQEMGSKHVNKDINEAHVDEENKIVTAPAFMCETKVHEIFDSVGSMVNGVLKLC
ncbi:glutamine amidotransferase-like class 1 domain-containing protein 3A, mitochondrial [Strongylocentrotus purpuratus]|uniref:ES1 protein homolog, mitochondrial n=1 Tax=Strongylocentrotus purpuratus TaxID=7668 RepID=A0A7M7GFG3_STRPU|nr:glutamine amidotransferase-like class 1 domain-containing protein 3A, mitochondrial [Strongylocentrotus purpuratus]